VVVSEENPLRRFQRAVEGGRAVNPTGTMPGLDMVGSVLKAERRMGIQPRHFLAHRCGHHFVMGRALLGGDEMLFCRSTERAAVGVKADHVEAADQADVLLAFHLSLLQPLEKSPSTDSISCFLSMSFPAWALRGTLRPSERANRSGLQSSCGPYPAVLRVGRLVAGVTSKLRAPDRRSFRC
jgi:hypothetical protein